MDANLQHPNLKFALRLGMAHITLATLKQFRDTRPECIPVRWW